VSGSEAARGAGGKPRRPVAAPEIVEIDRSFLEDVCRLEARCYPAPWSAALIRGEFEKSASMRIGVRVLSTLVAYSFNYLVVDELHVLNVAVAPEQRGKGYGSLLLRTVLETGKRRGARYATLEVRESNLVAQELYEKAGFRFTGRRKAYYRNNGEDALVMERDL
jgi:ribosomal-protein-alanine N-acetyltransferase